VPAAVIAISMFVAIVLGTPSKASQQCMSKAEARQHFGSVHIYWHGRVHCWDATAPRRVRESRKSPPFKWREAMSEIRRYCPKANRGYCPKANPYKPLLSPHGCNDGWISDHHSLPSLRTRWIGPCPSPRPSSSANSGQALRHDSCCWPVSLSRSD
jgi:hypothetical protein